jgi:hypothetical protein
MEDQECQVPSVRTPNGAIAGMFGYGSPAAPGASSFVAARSDAIDRQRIAALAMANWLARRRMDCVEFEFFICFLTGEDLFRNVLLAML